MMPAAGLPTGLRIEEHLAPVCSHAFLASTRFRQALDPATWPFRAHLTSSPQFLAKNTGWAAAVVGSTRNQEIMGC